MYDRSGTTSQKHAKEMALAVQHGKSRVVESRDQRKIRRAETQVHKAEQITQCHRSLETYYKIVG